MSKSYMGANVLFCGHDATFIADVHKVGNVNVVVGNGSMEKMLRRGIAKGIATHHLVDFPTAGYWSPKTGIFVVPAKQVKEIK